MNMWMEGAGREWVYEKEGESGRGGGGGLNYHCTSFKWPGLLP